MRQAGACLPLWFFCRGMLGEVQVINPGFINFFGSSTESVGKEGPHRRIK